MRSLLWFAVGPPLAIALHVLASRGAKAVVSAAEPLGQGSAEGAGYGRSLYGTPGRASHEVVGIVLAAGALFGVAAVSGWSLVWFLGLLAVGGAVALELRRWERVAAGPAGVWFQRGMRQRVHHVRLDDIRDLSVQEEDIPGFSWRHGKRNRMCRLNLRLANGKVVALPKTDAWADLDAVEAVANQVRSRQELSRERVAREGGRAGVAPGRPSADEQPDATTAGTVAPVADDNDLKRALRRLQRSTGGRTPS